MVQPKHRKPRATRKESDIRIRVTDEQKRAFEAAALAAGLDVSNWLRSLATREVRK